MSIRTARWVLWLTFMLTLPVPFFLAETGFVPTARIGMLGLVAVAVLVAEGPSGVVRMTSALLLVQAAGYGGLFWIVATVGARALRRLAPGTIRRVTLLVAVVAVVWTAIFAMYRDPFRAHLLHTTLLHVYE